jgi:hypothetical protein
MTEDIDKLFISVMDGSQYQIPYNENFTGKQVKLRVKALVGAQVDGLVLLFHGREIPNDLTLSNLSILKNNTVFYSLNIYFNVFFR